MNDLIELADACHSGACNIRGITRSLGLAVAQVPPHINLRDCPPLKIILGQLSYLAGDSAGPSFEALEEWRLFREGKPAPQEAKS